MRVTKLIREYVEREVSAKFDPKFQALTEDFRREQDEMVKLLNERISAFREECIKTLTDAGFDPPKDRLVYDVSYYDIHKESAEKEIQKKRNELQSKKQEAIDSILIGLEIGEATKDDLKGLIAAVEV